MNKLTHTDKHGKAAMIDVGSKAVSIRTAKASGHITLSPDTIKLVNENQLKKGDVLTVGQIAGINGAKQCQALIPLCHNIMLDSIKVDLSVDSTGVRAFSEVKCTGRTGAEMEALTAVSVSLLTVYDMCKAVDRSMTIDRIKLDEKTKK
ncbi:MAG: cyclic pyranopterin monophosphate synthase MoaC [Bacteroidales bacterium]|nr:cyclic pyranopterin monophosphate synthase MoaC [Bacteroidales bacterium]